MSFPVTVTKDCFPSATECHNCIRKRRKTVTGDPNENKMIQDLKRCAGCHIMTYCDRDCQREHWRAVHKKHCKLLSGREAVPFTKHIKHSCPECFKDKDTTAAEFSSVNSPKTRCHLEGLIVELKEALGVFFHFHGERKTCNCSLAFACKVPFQMGELSGQFVDDCGLELMMAHTLKIIYAMGAKTRNREDIEKIQAEVWYNLIYSRASLWRGVLLGELTGTEFDVRERILGPVKSLEAFYGTFNPWWKALIFSATFIKRSNDEVLDKTIDLGITGEPRFKNLKVMKDFCQSQRQKKALVSATKQWGKLKLWPTSENNFTTLLLPEGTCCQECSSSLSGLFSQNLYDTLPTSMPSVGDNGEMMVCCSFKCVEESSKTNTVLRLVLENSFDQYNEDIKKFFVESRGCDFCLKLSLSSHRCSRCLAAQYCSTGCQHQDLDFHKSVCSCWAKQMSRKIAGGKKQMKIRKSQVED